MYPAGHTRPMEIGMVECTATQDLPVSVQAGPGCFARLAGFHHVEYDAGEYGNSTRTRAMAEEMTALKKVLTSMYKDGMIAWMHAHPEAYEEAITLAIADMQPYSWRAAWLLCDCLEKNDARVRPHIRKIILAIPSKNDGHQRELLKILQLMELRERDESAAFDVCISMWEKITAQPSVRVNALKVLVNIARRHPDLAREVRLLVHDRYLDTFSEPVRKSVIRILKGISL